MKRKDSPHGTLFCCVYTASYPLRGQSASPSVFLLLEEKLQRRVPLIPWKAIRQLAVIQRLGNCTRGGEQNISPCPSQQNHLREDDRPRAEQHVRPGAGRSDVPGCLVLSEAVSFAAQSWRKTRAESVSARRGVEYRPQHSGVLC